MKSPKLPETVKIGGFVWKVKLSHEVTTEGNCFGCLHYTTQTIYIDPRAPSQKQQQCLLHEILHALWWQTGLRVRVGIKEHEEEVVQALSNLLYQVLKDNGLVTSWR